MGDREFLERTLDRLRPNRAAAKSEEGFSGDTQNEVSSDGSPELGETDSQEDWEEEISPRDLEEVGSRFGAHTQLVKPVRAWLQVTLALPGILSIAELIANRLDLLNNPWNNPFSSLNPIAYTSVIALAVVLPWVFLIQEWLWLRRLQHSGIAVEILMTPACSEALQGTAQAFWNRQNRQFAWPIVGSITLLCLAHGIDNLFTPDVTLEAFQQALTQWLIPVTLFLVYWGFFRLPLATDTSHIFVSFVFGVSHFTVAWIKIGCIGLALDHFGFIGFYGGKIPSGIVVLCLSLHGLFWYKRHAVPNMKTAGAYLTWYLNRKIAKDS